MMRWSTRSERIGSLAAVAGPVFTTGCAFFLAWQIVSHSLVAYLVRYNPKIAYSIAPSNPVVLTALAAQAMDSVEHSDSDPDVAITRQRPTREQLRQWALAALAAAPLNPTALRILGQIEDERGHSAQAEAFMRQAARVSKQETRALLWLLKNAYVTGHLPVATEYADALLSTRPLATHVVPVLALIAEDRVGFDAVKQLIAKNPSWRSEFFQLLPKSVTDAEIPLQLLLSLKSTSAPASAAEFAPYLKFLLQKKLYDLAYYGWLQSLPDAKVEAVQRLFNGNFSSSRSGAPFDWTVLPGKGVLIEFAQSVGSSGRQGLLVQFRQGRAEFGGVSQVLLLAPGAYRLRGKYRGDLSGRRGLEWQIACLGGVPRPIAETRQFLGAARQWTEFELSFEIPREECRAQNIRLAHMARSASDQFISGSIWFDELSISVQQSQ